MAKQERPPRGEQGSKDNSSRRVNFDNERESKFDKRFDSKRGGSRGKGRDIKNKASNDIAWYSKNAELLKSAVSISTYDVAGMTIPVTDVQSVPGVLALYWSPNLGGNINEAINQAANYTYSYVVHANSRNYNYDPADMMFMIIAGMSAFDCLAMGVRAFGIMNNFNALDMYTPAHLINRMGFDYDDLRDHLSDMWFDLNEMINAMTQIWIPNTMPLQDRWFWMNSYIYKDAESAKAQYYMFVQERFFKFTAKTESTGSSLEGVSWFSPGATTISYNTWAGYKAFFWNLLNAMLQNQDRGMIFGDILKAYGADKLFAMNPISSDYRVTPVYEKEVLMQIENATVTGMIVGRMVQDGNGRITQLMAETTSASIEANSLILPKAKVLNFHTATAPSEADIMIASRLSVVGTNLVANSNTPVGYQVAPEAGGTEIIHIATISWVDWTNGVPSVTFKSILPATLASGTTVNYPHIRQLLSAWSAFDWAPWLVGATTVPASQITGTGSYSADITSMFGDYDWYTFVYAPELTKMHNCALYSLLGVPQM